VASTGAAVNVAAVNVASIPLSVAVVGCALGLAWLMRPAGSGRAPRCWQRLDALLSVSARPSVAATVSAALPDALESVARHMRSGVSQSGALAAAASQTTGPLAEQWQRVADDVAQGRAFVAALEDWSRTEGSQEARLVVAALTLGVDVGGGRARAVDSVAASLRDRASLAAEIRAQGAQARLSAWVISAAPLVFVGISAATDARIRHVLTRTPLGWACVVVGLSLDALGALWMRHMARAALAGW
jgi:tight adherence protein B